MLMPLMLPLQQGTEVSPFPWTVQTLPHDGAVLNAVKMAKGRWLVQKTLVITRPLYFFSTAVLPDNA